MRCAVHWAIGIDPCKTREELRANDPETAEREALIEGWAELPGGEVGIGVAEAVQCLNADPEQRLKKLRDCMMQWSKTKELPSNYVIAKKLQRIKGRVCNGRRVVARSYKGTQEWKVEKV